MSAPTLLEPHRVHEPSVFGPWCYICGKKRHWWAFWDKWQPIQDDHDEPF